MALFFQILFSIISVAIAYVLWGLTAVLVNGSPSIPPAHVYFFIFFAVQVVGKSIKSSFENKAPACGLFLIAISPIVGFIGVGLLDFSSRFLADVSRVNLKHITNAVSGAWIAFYSIRFLISKKSLFTNDDL